jgi:hypothetical protein
MVPVGKINLLVGYAGITDSAEVGNPRLSGVPLLVLVGESRGLIRRGARQLCSRQRQ